MRGEALLWKVVAAGEVAPALAAGWRSLDWVEITGPFDYTGTAPVRVHGGGKTVEHRITWELWWKMIGVLPA
jgi:hypothetical protein